MSTIRKVRFLLPLIAVVALLVGCGGAKKEKSTSLAVDSKAPVFTLPGSDGQAVTLSNYFGKTNVLLYFNMLYG